MLSSAFVKCAVMKWVSVPWTFTEEAILQKKTPVRVRTLAMPCQHREMKGQVSSTSYPWLKQSLEHKPSKLDLVSVNQK